jgi:hypothetical protein
MLFVSTKIDRQDDRSATVCQQVREKICDNMLPLAKPTYFDMRSVGGWRRSVDRHPCSWLQNKK